MDVAAIVGSAVQDASPEMGSESSVETPDVSESTADSTEMAATETETPTQEAKPAEKVKEEPLDPEIQKYVKQGGKNGREPMFPLSAHKKVLTNARKETEAKAQELQQVQAKLKEIEAKAAAVDKWDRDIANDPDGVVRRLAVAHPDKWGKFLRNDPQPAAKAPAQTDFPAPDVKNPDGSVGYSAQGLQKFLEWVQGSEDRAAARAEKVLQAKFQPIEQQQQQDALKATMRRSTEAQVQKAREYWGDLFEEDFQKGGESEIIKYALANQVSYEHAQMAVLLPKLKAKQAEQLNGKRDAVLKELKTRPEVADKSVPSTTKGDSGASGPRTTRDIVAERIANLR